MAGNAIAQWQLNYAEPSHLCTVFYSMYLRFVVPSLGRKAWGLIGIIQAAWDIRDACAFALSEEAEFDDLCRWFNLHLPVPWRFSRSRRRGAAYNAVCWFKSSAGECVQKARLLAELLEDHGLQIVMLRTRRPGYIVYEDWWQVVAEPFSDTFHIQN